MKNLVNAKTAIITTAAALVATPIIAFAAFNVGDNLGTDQAAIIAQLEAAGYEDIELEMEDGVLEAEAWDVAADMEVELEIDPATGEILYIETEGDYAEDMAPTGDVMKEDA